MTQKWGFDYSFSRPSIATLVANGTQFVCRYLSGSGKALTSYEANLLKAANIIVGLHYETTGTTYTGGYNAGVADGQAAAAAARALGCTAGTIIWFAVDRDESNTALTNSYLQGCKAGTAEFIAQLYGSYKVVEAAYAAGLGDNHCQTYAWSNGLVSSRALVYQYQNNISLADGSAVDRCRTLKDIAGPWLHPASAPAPVQPPSGGSDMQVGMDYWPKDGSKPAQWYYACVGTDNCLYYQGPETAGKWVCVDPTSNVRGGPTLVVSADGSKRIAYVNANGVPSEYVADPGSDAFTYGSLGGKSA